MRTIVALWATSAVAACVPAQKDQFLVVNTLGQPATAQATANAYCEQTGRYALAADRRWDYIGFQCVDPASTTVAQNPIPPR